MNHNHFIVPHLQEKKSQQLSYQSVLLDFMKEKIRCKLLQEGDPIPSYRAFAVLNDIHANTAKRLYEHMRELGLITGRPGAPSRISATLQLPPGRASHFDTDRAHLPAQKSADSRAAAAILQTYFSIGIDRPRLSSLDKPDLSKYLRYAFQKEIGKYQIKLLKQMYDYNALEAAIRRHLRHHNELLVEEGELMMIRGRYQSLQRVFKTLLTDEDAVLNTQPQDSLAAAALSTCAEQVYNISVAEPDFIARLTAFLETTPIKLLYIRAQCSFPEGYTLSDVQAEQLVSLAVQHQFYIVDEMEDHEFWYGKTAYKSLAMYPHLGHVVLLYGLSKLSYEMEIFRFVCATSRIIAALKILQEDHHAGLYVAEQAIVGLLDEGILRRFQIKINKTSRQHLKLLEQMLKSELSDYISFESPQCGLSLWIRFPDDLDLKVILDRLAEGSPRIEIPYQPPVQYTIRPVHHMRLGFGPLNLQEGLIPAQKLPKIIDCLRAENTRF